MNNREYALYIARILALPLIAVAFAILFFVTQPPISYVAAVLAIAAAIAQIILAIRRARARDR